MHADSRVVFLPPWGDVLSFDHTKERKIPQHSRPSERFAVSHFTPRRLSHPSSLVGVLLSAGRISTLQTSRLILCT